MAFLYNDLSSLQLRDTDEDSAKMAKLTAFRAELESKRIVKYWRESDELVTVVKDSVNDMVRRKPAVGWIRGDQAFDPEVYKELERIRRENEELRNSISDDDVAFPKSIASGEDKIEIRYLVDTFKKIDEKRVKTGASQESFTITCDKLIKSLSSLLYSESTEFDIRRYLSESAERVYRKRSESNSDDSKEERHIHVSDGMVATLRFHFEALGIITTVLKKSKQSFMPSHFDLDEEEVSWKLTEKGRKYIATMNAIKKPTNPAKSHD